MKREKKYILMVIVALFVFIAGNKASNVKANSIYPSQCGTNNSSCSHANDSSILSGQCEQYFSGSCGSMLVYLNAMMLDCENKKPAGITCATIVSGSFYGNEAAKYANFVAADKGLNSLTANSIEVPNVGLPDPKDGIKGVLANLLRWMLGIVGVIALIGFVVSGIQYVISTGDEGMMESAKKNMMYSITGIVVVLASFVIIQAIDYALRAEGLF